MTTISRIAIPTTGDQRIDRMYTLIGRLTVPEWTRMYEGLDWESSVAELRDPDLAYPAYYLCDRHGVKGGYMNGWQAIGWSLAARFYGLAPHYTKLGQHVAALVNELPRPRIADIGAGTGDWLLHVGMTLPQASCTAIDLSPYMLAALHHRWVRQGLSPERLRCVHAAGEASGLPSASVDIVTALLVYHELPHEATMAMYREAHRILRPGGHFIVLDAIQHPIPHDGLNELGVRAVAVVFHEPDFRAYTHLHLPTIAHEAGFRATRTMYYGRLPWKFQITDAW